MKKQLVIDLTESSKFPAEQLFGVERRREADDFIRLTMEMKNDRTKSLETQGFRTCLFGYIPIVGIGEYGNMMLS